MVEKDFIISEIQRTAALNDGKPLGVARFKAQTGIDIHEWFGRYWARWGDALREAGFAPNTMRPAYKDEWVLEQFALLIRELGHFPTQGERQLRARRGNPFPTNSVFRRLGTRADIAARIVNTYADRSDFQDVVTICRSVAGGPTGATTPIRNSEPACESESFGHVYLIKSGRFYKIGYTNSLDQRYRNLAIQLPQKAKPIHSIASDDPVGIEAYWHRRFDAKRLHGEWFNLDSDDIRAFKRREFM